MSLAILFDFLCAQHVSDTNISIIRSLRLFCWITTLVVLFLVRCMLVSRCGWVGVVSVWNKTTCDIKLVFYSSAITMMRGPINIRTKHVGVMTNCVQNIILSLAYLFYLYEFYVFVQILTVYSRI